MNRRAFILSSGLAGSTLLAGCTGTAPDQPPASEQGEPASGADTEPAPTDRTATPTSTPTPSETATADPTPVEDLSAPRVRWTGTGPGTSDRFTALGGPVLLTLRFDYAGMRNSNFIVGAVDDSGRTLLPSVLAINELFAPHQSEETDEYTARLVTHFEPGEYFIDVTHAGGPYGDGEWEIAVEQPGVPTDGRTLPVTVEGRDTDVIGPLAFDGPTRISLETLEPRLAFDGEPATYNYQVRTANALGRPGELVINSTGPAPESLSKVWFPEDGGVGYVNVHSFGPWRATIEAA
jgi:hypothetical protein